MNFDSVGCWRDLVYRRRAFVNARVEDFYASSESKLEALRVRSMLEEADLCNTEEEMDSSGIIVPELMESSSDSSCGSFVSLASAGEFLM